MSSAGILQRPSASEVAVREAPVAVLVTVMVAPGIAAPAVSVTSPESEPVADCAKAETLSKAVNSARNKVANLLRGLSISSPEISPDKTLMDAQLCRNTSQLADTVHSDDALKIGCEFNVGKTATKAEATGEALNKSEAELKFRQI
jgi:hypothetical protein